MTPPTRLNWFATTGWEWVVNYCATILGRSPTPDERMKLAAALFRECFEPNMIVRLADVAETTGDPAFLHLASRHHDWQVRVASIANGSLGPARVAAMSFDPDPSVRAAALRSPHRDPGLVDRVLAGLDPTVADLLGIDFIEDLRAGVH